MEIEELRREAKKLGYNLTKNYYVKRNPCPNCGSKKVPMKNDHHYLWRTQFGAQLNAYLSGATFICCNCGWESKPAFSILEPREQGRILNWNEGLEFEQKPLHFILNGVRYDLVLDEWGPIK